MRATASARSTYFLITFLASAWIARGTVPPGSQTALIWPAAGVAAVWLGTAARHQLAGDVVLLVAATIGIDLATGSAPEAVLYLIAGNVAGALVFRALGRRWLGHLWGTGGQDPVTTINDLSRFLMVSTVSAAAAAAAGFAGRNLLTGRGHTEELLIWWARSGIGTFTVAILLVVVLQPFATAPSGARGRVLADGLRPTDRAHLAEASLLFAISAGMLVAVIWRDQIDSLTYMLVLTVVWAGLRFSTVFVVVHGMTLGRALLTSALISGRPFHDVADQQQRALMAQGFLMVILLTGLTLVLGRRTLDRTGDALAAAQAQAAERNALLAATMESMTEGLVVLDENGRVLLRNAAAVDLVGLHTDMPEYVSPSSAVAYLRHPDGRPVRVEDLPGSRLLAGLDPGVDDFHVRAPGVPHGRVLQMSAQLLPPADDGTRRAMVTMRDVTADRQHRDALANFAGTVAHDLFTPLTMINGWAELLEEAFESGPVDTAVGFPAAQRIHSSAQHMRDVIRDLLAYTVARDQTLLLTDIDLSDTLEKLARLRRGGPHSPCIQVQSGIGVRADHALIRQLFDNLIGNAIKYTEPGVTPLVRITARERAGTAEIRVSDNGIGIPTEDREHVFAPYHRVDDTGRGTGLGLAICRRIVDRHGGSIQVEDGPHGTGTTVVVTLPAAEPGSVRVRSARTARV